MKHVYGFFALVVCLLVGCSYQEGECWAPDGTTGYGQGGGPVLPGEGGYGLEPKPQGDDEPGSELDDDCRKPEHQCRCTGRVLCEWVGDDNSDDTLPFHFCYIENDAGPDGWIDGTCTEVKRGYYEYCRNEIIRVESRKGSPYVERKYWACASLYMDCKERRKK